MTEAEFLQSHIVLTNEVENALESLFIYIEIDDFANNHPVALQRMNRYPEFWLSIRHAQQTTFMITLGRVFDNDRRSHSIHRLLKEMISHPEYFSREAFANRRRGPSPGPDPEYLADYLRDVFEPNKASLEKLEAALKPISDKYKVSFCPIRNKLFAHRDMLDKQSINALVSKGLIVDLEEILHFLHDLLDCIWQLIHNGREPNLGHAGYNYRERAKRATEGVLEQLLNIPATPE